MQSSRVALKTMCACTAAAGVNLLLLLLLLLQVHCTVHRGPCCRSSVTAWRPTTNILELGHLRTEYMNLFLLFVRVHVRSYLYSSWTAIIYTVPQNRTPQYRLLWFNNTSSVLYEILVLQTLRQVATTSMLLGFKLDHWRYKVYSISNFDYVAYDQWQVILPTGDAQSVLLLLGHTSSDVDVSAWLPNHWFPGQTFLLFNQSCLEVIKGMNVCSIHALLHYASRVTVYRIQIKTAG